MLVPISISSSPIFKEDKYFILQSEIETIWNDDSNVKKVHFILLFPSFEKVEESIKYLSKFGNIANEGRPKIYISAEKLIFFFLLKHSL